MQRLQVQCVGIFMLAWGLVSASSTASAEQRSLGVLKRVGALHCTGWQTAEAATTRLRCSLRLADVDVEQRTYEGELRGEGLYLVSPGQIRVLWNVLAPTRILEPTAIAGDYDTASKYKFEYAGNKPNLLVGGMNDVVALELLAPNVDPIDPSTRLTLRLAD